MKFNAETTKDFRSDLESVLAKAFPELRFNLGNMTYDREGDNVSVTLEAVSGLSRGEKDLLNAMKRDGIPYPTNKKGDILVEYSRRARKYPYIYKTLEGKLFKITREDAMLKFGAV